jgi:MFS transporter, ACDE family, multidrug resistance protein
VTHISGKLAEHSLALPFWVGAAVLAFGALVYLAFGHVMAVGSGEMAVGSGERVLWARWNRAARSAEGTPEEPIGEAV